MTEWPDSSFNLYEKFEKLPYKNKVLFTIKPHPEFPSTFCLSDAGKRFGDLSKIFEFKSLFCGYRYYDEFDFVSFLNIGNCETSYARSAILIENKKRIRLAHESLDEKVNQLILGAL